MPGNSPSLLACNVFLSMDTYQVVGSSCFNFSFEVVGDEVQLIFLLSLANSAYVNRTGLLAPLLLSWKCGTSYHPPQTPLFLYTYLLLVRLEYQEISTVHTLGSNSTAYALGKEIVECQKRQHPEVELLYPRLALSIMTLFKPKP